MPRSASDASGDEGELREHLIASLPGTPSETSEVDPTDLPLWLSRYIQELVGRSVASLPASQRPEAGGELVNQIVKLLKDESPNSGIDEAQLLHLPPTLLTGVGKTLPIRPSTPLSDHALFTRAPDEPRLISEIEKEFASATQVDAVIAFIRWSGLRLLAEPIRELIDRGGRLRIITTTYTGSTERLALERLIEMGAEVNVTYETQSTRLHAKAWMFHRLAGLDTAWIGSSNLSRTAMVDGLEWNVRASQVTTPSILEKFQATFETYWSDPHFETFDPEQDRDRFDRATQRDAPTPDLDVSFLEVHPYPFQQDMLDRLEVERSRHGRSHNLVVAATGTGKTVVAALDFRRLRSQLERNRLLFVAHRKEILQQSLRTFRTVLTDGSFGELYVDGHRPEEWEHVFASIQSLDATGVEEIDPTHFDVVIIDEFHHAAAPTYERLINHLKPEILLGLTATPERYDGLSITKWFDDRIAVELRLWDAIDLGRLVPFHYFGIHDDVDLANIKWGQGGYVTAELTSLYTGNEARVAKIVAAIRDRVADPSKIRALGFCVSIEHAEYMARQFNRAGIDSVALTSRTPSTDRERARKSLDEGQIQVIFTVDLFNEGVDIPSIDTVLFLRPTESATVFLQQLGRGLRFAEGKALLTVLDFVGHQHQKFRFDRRYRAVLGGSRQDLITQIENGFPTLPSGCHFELDRVAREMVLKNIRESLPDNINQRVAELRQLGDVSLTDFLAKTGLDLEEIYRGSNCWITHRRRAGLEESAAGPHEERLARALGRILHIDDQPRISTYRSALTEPAPPDPDDFTESEKRLWTMLHYDLWGVTPDKSPSSLADGLLALWDEDAIRAELQELLEILDNRAMHVEHDLDRAEIPLVVHARYSRDEALAAMGIGSPSSPPSLREGVKWDKGSNTDLAFVTLQKSEAEYSPTTRYNDYAISPELFHWESQSTISTDSPTGQRYLEQRSSGTHFYLFVRESRRDRSGTRDYMFLGPAQYVTHQGERPISITWKLEYPMPMDLYQRARVVAG